MKKNVLVYTDDRTATGSLIPSLRQSFASSEFSILMIGTQDIRRGILTDKSSRILVLPGIRGDVSRYRHDLGRDELQRIKNFIERDKNVLLTICAGTWHISRTAVFAPTGQQERISLCLNPLFNGVARGPYEPCSSKSYPAGPIIVPVKFQTPAGTWEESGVFYDKGPLLFPNDPDDKNMSILAIYPNIPDNPAALLRLQFGKGAVYMSSMHPEIYYCDLPGKNGLKNARIVMAAMKPHEENRQKLWASITDRIKMDLGT